MKTGSQKALFQSQQFNFCSLDFHGSVSLLLFTLCPEGGMPPPLLHPPSLFSLLKTQTECETFPDLQFPSKKELNISLFYVSIATYKCRCFTYSGGFPYCRLDIIKYIGTWIAVARLVTDSITQLWFGAATAFCRRTIRLNE